MSRKCCKSDPPCKDCPKRKKKRHRACCVADCPAAGTVAIVRCTYLPATDISISGQRG